MGYYWQDSVAVRLIIGHEKLADGETWQQMQQAWATSSDDVKLWMEAHRKFGSGSNKEIQSALAKLKEIPIGTGAGNSRQDLSLSFMGWELGKMIRDGEFSSNSDVATWIRINIGGASSGGSRAKNR